MFQILKLFFLSLFLDNGRVGLDEKKKLYNFTRKELELKVNLI